MTSTRRIVAWTVVRAMAGRGSQSAEGMHREVQLRENIVAKGREYPGNPGSTATSSGKG